LLFLARVRSSTLCAIPHAQSSAIDSLIEQFIQEHTPRQIAEYEEHEMYVWMTLAPIVHMAFAAGQKLRKTAMERNTNNESYTAKKSKVLVENVSVETERQEFTERELATALPSGFSVHTDNYVTALNRNLNDTTEIEFGNVSTARWPGSPAVQKLAIFALQHTLHSKENRELLITEDLHSFLICLQWQLKEGTEYEKLRKELLVIGDSLKVPTLRVICKSVLASMNGLESVLKI
jgi:hypothetical protein